MVEALVEAEGVLVALGVVVPADAFFGSAGVAGSGVRDLEADGLGWDDGPALVEQRSAAGGEADLPDEVDGVGAVVISGAGGGDGEEVLSGDAEEVLGGEAVGGGEDVGLAPADELAAGFEGEVAFVDCGAEAAQRQGGAFGGAVLKV